MIVITITIKRKWQQGTFLETSCFFFILLLSKLYYAGTKRKIYSIGISKPTAPGPLADYTSLH